MLVITRRSQEKVVFPDIGLTIQILKILGGNVRLGVDAPNALAVLREELLKPEDKAKNYTTYSKKLRHDLRNDLQHITVALHLYRELLESGITDEAVETFQTIMAALKRIESNPILNDFVPESTFEQIRHLSRFGFEPVNKNPITVVLAEDNFEQRMVLAKLLRTHKFEVIELSDGNEVMEYFKRHSAPKFLLIDMNMPTCDGATAIETLRQQNQLSDTLVFAVSGHKPEDYGVQVGGVPVGAKGRGVDQWFPKPIDPTVLISQINAGGVGAA